MNTQQQAELHLRELINLLRRRWKLITATGVLAASLAGAIGLIVPPRYTATAEVIVDPPRGTSGSGPPGTAGVLDDSAVQTHVAALMSQGHLRRVFDSLVAERGREPTERRGLLGVQEFSFETFTDRINAFKDTRSRMIGVTYTSTDPAFAATVANRSVEIYLTTLTERNRADRNYTLRSLRKQIPLVRAEVARRIANLQDANTEARGPEVRLREMQREATAYAQLYDSLSQREKTILEEEDVQPDVRALSSASVPTRPSSLNPLLFVLPAMVLAVIGAGLLAVLLDRLDGTLRTERDATDALGIPCIGVIPRIIPLRKKGLHQPIQGDARYEEAIRSLAAAALQLTNPMTTPKVFLVTSSLPGEGKTTLAIGFAAYAASLRRRVLLLDLAFRHPSIASNLGGSDDGGLLHVLQGQPIAEEIKVAQRLGFDYLPLSRNSPDPVATLACERFPELLRQLKENYDCVVIDSGPLLSATEARLLASMVDHVLFAIKWGSTRCEVAQNALGLIRLLASRQNRLREITSAVITQVDLKRHARYRYGDSGEGLLHVKPHPA